MPRNPEVFNFKRDPVDNWHEDPDAVGASIREGEFPLDEKIYSYKTENHDDINYVFGIEGLTRAVEICQMRIGGNGVYDEDSHETGSSAFGFTKSKNMDEVEELVRSGWTEGVKRMNEVSEAISQIVGSKIERETTEYDISGEEVDPVAFATGEIECMCNYDTEIDDQQDRCVNVVVHMGVLGDVETNTIINRGATIVAVLGLLKNMGCSTKLWVISDMEGDGSSHFMTAILVKDYQDQIDEDLISFCTSHPSMHRRINFSLREHMDEWCINYAGIESGGGACSTVNVASKCDPDILFDRTTNEEYKDVEDSVRLAIEKLNGCKGITINDEEVLI